MEDISFYVKLKSAQGKSIIKHCFINEIRMEFVGDMAYEIKVFVCSESLFENNDESTICYFQCGSLHGCEVLKTLIRALLEHQSYVMCCPSRYCCDNVLTKGYCIWRLD